MNDSVQNVDVITVHIAVDGFRWTRKDGGNHKITGASTEAYTTKGAALDNIASTQGGEYVIEEDD